MISQSKEFFINMKEKDIPKWNPKLSYFEQDPYVIDFYENERNKYTKGLTINGVFIHPWLYWHVNFFKSRIAQEDDSEPIVEPTLDDNSWYFIENYMEAEKNGKGVCMFGTRGFSKTVILASLSHWMAVKNHNGIIDINGGSSNDLNDITKAIKLSNDNIHPFIKLPILQEDWSKEVVFGFRETNSTTINSTLKIVNHEEGKDKASEKSAGGTPSGFIVDEIGKFDCRKLLQAALPKFSSQYKAKLVHVLAGTGGSDKLSEGAKFILSNPEAYKLIPMNWDRLDNIVDPEYATWKEDKNIKFCTFVPGQMSYRNGCPKKKTNLADFLKKDSKSLKKINISVTDWEKATKHCLSEVDILPEGEDKNRRIMYFPLKASDCFLVDSPNPFNVQLLSKKLQEIKENPKYRCVELHEDYDGSIKEVLSEKKLAPREYENKDTDAPIMIFEQPIDDLGEYCYCGAIDDYKTTSAKDSKSLGSLYILKRANLELNCPTETIALSYTARPHASHNILYNNFRLSLKKYNALANIEAIDVGFANFLETSGFNTMDFLTPNLNPSQDLSSNKKTKANSKYGTYPTPGNVKILMDTVIDYVNKDHVVAFDGETPVIKFGAEFIEDPFLIEEMINYKYNGNFDRIIAFGWALLYSRYLDQRKVKPKRNKKYRQNLYERTYDESKYTKKKKVKGFSNFSSNKFRNF